MEIKVDDVSLFSLATWEKDVIKYMIPSADFEADMKRRLQWVLQHKCEQCYKRFEDEWLDKLRADPAVDTIPADKQAFVELVIARPDYKDRDARDAEGI